MVVKAEGFQDVMLYQWVSGSEHGVTQGHVPENSNLWQHCCENLKSHVVKTVCNLHLHTAYIFF